MGIRIRAICYIFRILLFGERRAADNETEDTLRGPLRGHSGEPRRRMRTLPQTKRSTAVALGVSSRPLHDRRVHCPLVQIETHARYFRSSKYQSRLLLSVLGITENKKITRVINHIWLLI